MTTTSLLDKRPALAADFPSSTGEIAAPLSYEELTRRYMGEGGLLSRPGYIPDLGEFGELQTLANTIWESRRVLAPNIEDDPVVKFYGPDGKIIDTTVAHQVFESANPARWVRDKGDERLFIEAADAWDHGKLIPFGDTLAVHKALLQAADMRVQDVLGEGQSNGQRLRRLVDLSRESRAQLEHWNVDTAEVLRAREGGKRERGEIRKELVWAVQDNSWRETTLDLGRVATLARGQFPGRIYRGGEAVTGASPTSRWRLDRWREKTQPPKVRASAPARTLQ